MKEYQWLYKGETIAIRQQSVIKILEEKGIRAACLQADGQETSLSMEELLLDERIVENGIILDKTLIAEVGGKNTNLPAKWEYELALRVAASEPIKRIPLSLLEEAGLQQIRKENGRIPRVWNNFCVDAYITGRYCDFLKKQGLFEVVLEAVLQEGMEVEEVKKVEEFLADMIAHRGRYFYYYDATQPILIFCGAPCCYNVLNVFAEKIAEALKNLGNCVAFYDAETEDVQGLTGLIGKRYKALVGFQAWILSAQRKGEKNSLLDRIGGPKYNFIFDHPIWMQKQLQNVPARYYALTHDRNYVRFIEEYDSDVSGVFLLPPGGRSGKKMDRNVGVERIFDVTFLGTYGDYRKNLAAIEKSAPEAKMIATDFFSYMKKNPNTTAEEAFLQTLACHNMKLQKQAFLELFSKMKTVIQGIMYYYREKVVEEILRAGIELHVYGDSWKQSPFVQNPLLKVHEAVYDEEVLQVLAQSKISLNVMAWHKDGFTERIADSMLAGAVVVSDYSSQLEEFYGDETVRFDLNKIENLPHMLKELLADEEKRQNIAVAAEKKADAAATWEARAKELLQIIEKESRNR